MSTATLIPLTHANSPDMFGLTVASIFAGEGFTAVGDTDGGACVRVSGDGKSLHVGANTMGTIRLYFEDDGVSIPIGAVINSVQLVVRHQVTAGFFAFPLYANLLAYSALSYTAVGYSGLGADPLTFAYQNNSPTTMTVNPVTLVAWTRADLFPSPPYDTFCNGGWQINGAATDIAGSYDIDKISLVVDYTAGALSWYYNPTTNHYSYTSSDPGVPWLVQSVAPVPTIDAANTTDTVNKTAVNTTVTDGVAPPVTQDNALVTVAGVPTAKTDVLSNTLLMPGIGCSAGGDAVVITGRGFGNSATVKFGGVAATSVVVKNATKIICVTPAHADGAVDVVITNADATTVTATSGFTYGTPWWMRSLVVVVNRDTFIFQVSVQQCEPPTTGIWVLQSLTTPSFVWWFHPINLTYIYQVTSPGTGWINAGVTTPTPADPNGWYTSSVAFTGSVGIIAGSRPADPRTWTKIAAWATSNTAMLGGSPAASCVFENHLVYPADNYTLGTTYPTIRVFDGSFDHELAKLPPTSTNGVPKAVLSMLAANGTIYFTSFDSGTTSADWSGRVFQLEISSGLVVPLGAPFTGGEMPYALAWHMGRLWVGTNNGIGTVGKVYYFRPNIDTAWTQDHSLASETAGGVDSMLSYKGKLYIGTDNAALARGKVVVRDSSGNYSVSETGAGGASAVVNNGYIAMAEFGGNLYASYWNNSATAFSMIRKFDNSSWSTVYTGATTTLRPYIVLFVDNSQIFAIGGGMTLAGALVRSSNGTAWTNLTAQLPETNKTLLPVYGVEVL